MKYTKKGIRRLAVIGGLVFILAGCTLIQGSEGATFSKLKLLSKQISRLYIGELNQQELDEGVYTGYVEGLENPVSGYLNAADYKAHLASEEGKQIGTGLKFTWGLDGNHLVIIEVVPDSPADKAGIKVGDQIIQVDDTKVIFSNENTLAKILSNAEEGTSNTYIIRKNANSNNEVEETITMTKELIEMPSLVVDTIDNTAYLKLQNIKEDTSEEIKIAIEDFKQKGIQKVVLDIRELYSNNLDETLKICDLFLDKMVAFKVKDKADVMKEYYTTEGKVTDEVVLLTSGSTKGIVEAIPAALKGEVTIIGTHSAGAGYLSQLFPLEDGTGLRLATGILYTRDNEPLNEEGVSVDEEVNQSLESMFDLLSEGTMSYESDAQLQAALTKLNK